VTVLLVLGLLLIGTAVVMLSRALIVSRLRATDTLSQIGRYGFTGSVEKQQWERGEGFRALFDSLAAGIGHVFTEELRVVNAERLQKTLIAAGLRQTTPDMVAGYSAFCAIGLPALWIALAVAVGMTASVAVLITLLFAAIGWVLPGFILQRQAEGRLYRIDHAMPELIDLLVVTVEAGLSLSAALQLAGQRMQGPLGEELRIVLQEERMGLTPVQALENMVGRTPTPAVESFARAMMQGELLGVSVGQILRSLAIEMRKRRRAQAEAQAQKAPIKMLFPLVFMIFPALFVVILGPALISIFHALNRA
jgi:tight adherence protein C